MNRAPARIFTFAPVSVFAADAAIAVNHMDYRIVVRGELDARFAYLFDGMRMERHEGTTVLEGPVRDRAQLHGFIDRIQELGLELLAIEQIAEPPEDGT